MNTTIDATTTQPGAPTMTDRPSYESDDRLDPVYVKVHRLAEHCECEGRQQEAGVLYALARSIATGRLAALAGRVGAFAHEEADGRAVGRAMRAR